MKINIPVLHKTLKVNNKTVKVPRLGIKHYKALSDINSTPIKTLRFVLSIIHPKLSMAESEFVLIHLLTFNNLIPESAMIGDFEYNLNNVYIKNKTVFELNGQKYKFKQPQFGQQFNGPLDVLNKLSKDNIKFDDMPASVLKWVKPLMSTIQIDTPEGTVYGLNNIIGLNA